MIRAARDGARETRGRRRAGAKARASGDARRLFVSLAMMRIVVVVVVVASAARVERARASTIVDASSDVRTGGFAEARGRALRGTSDAEACRARAWATGADAPGGASTAEATCAAISATSATRCEAAMASLKCRLARAGARARAEACDLASADDCERCVLRALGRGARGRGNLNDNDWDDAVEDEAAFESDRAITLDRAVEFSMYVDETHAIDSDCKFLVSMFRAEMASRVVESFSTLLAEAQREAKARAEEITIALAEIDEAARRNARDVEQAAMALDKVRRDQLEFATRFETFAANLNAALDRVERASRGALRAARFAAELAKRCAGIVSETFASLVSVEMIFVRFIVIAFGTTRPALRRRCFTALLVEWMLRAAPRTAATTPSNRLRLGLLCAFAPRIWTYAKEQLHRSRRDDAETGRVDVGAKPRSGRRARGVPAARIEPSPRVPEPTIASPRRASARLRATKTTKII